MHNTRFVYAALMLLPAIVGCGRSDNAESQAYVADEFPSATADRALYESAADDARVEQDDSVLDAQDFARRRAESDPGQWLLYSRQPVLSRGELGQWDDFRIGSPVVMKAGDSYRMWYRGCHFFGIDYTCGIGHATSGDGIEWEKAPEPVFVPDDVHESERLNSLAVVRSDDRYLMWYSVDADRFANRPYATLHLITSPDGLRWESKGLVLRAFSQYKSPIMHTALHDGERFHLWYADFPSGDEKEVLMHLTSGDGKQWQVAGASPLKSLGLHPGRLSVWSDGAGGYRALFGRPFQSPRWPHYGQDENGLFGRLASIDGNEWQLVEEPAMLPKALEHRFYADAPAVFRSRGEYWIWFAMHARNGAESIGLAWHKPLP